MYIRNVQVCLESVECVLYLSSQEITSFSRRGWWGHKGLWVIGNPDGHAWVSRKKRLPQRSQPNTQGTTLISFISFCASLLFFYLSYSLLIFPVISSLIAWAFSPLLYYPFSWLMNDTTRDRKQCAIGLRLEWVNQWGPINKICTKRTASSHE